MPIARIATVCMNGRHSPEIEENRAFGLSLLDEALGHRPDLVCLPEAFPLYSVGTELEESVEPIDGPTVAACAARAREHRCYVICPMKLRRDGRLYNSAVILGRDGRVAGVYDKHCPVTHSHDYTRFEFGITPGAELAVFDLDFGRVAVQICFDIGFEENWRALAEAGARLVFWPSAYDGGFGLRAYAYVHHYWVVSSVRHGRSRIIDPLGAIQHETDDESLVVWRDINLDFAVYHGDYNRPVRGRIEAAYGDRVALWDSAPGASHTILEPRDPSVTVAALKAEFGFEDTRQYHDRHRVGLARLRAGLEAEPQAGAHGDRSQYGG